MMGTNDWIADNLLAQEDKLLDQLHPDRVEPTPDPVSGPDLSKFPEPTPVDPKAEQQAFAELVRFLRDNPEEDCEFTALSPEEFAEITIANPDAASQE